MNKDEALELALEAQSYAAACLLNQLSTKDKHAYAVEKLSASTAAIKEALAQPEQYPQIAINPEIVGYVAPQRKPLSDEMVVAAARVLNERQADACGVNRDDQWAIYCDDFKADARAMLEATHNIKEEA